MGAQATEAVAEDKDVIDILNCAFLHQSGKNQNYFNICYQLL